MRPQAGLKRDESAQRGEMVQIKVRDRIQAVISPSRSKIRLRPASLVVLAGVPSGTRIPGLQRERRPREGTGRMRISGRCRGCSQTIPGRELPGKRASSALPLHFNHKSAHWSLKQGQNGAPPASLLYADFLSYHETLSSHSFHRSVEFCSSSSSPVRVPGLPGNDLVSVS